MKHSIRFVQFNYDESGRGKNILVLRGMDVREYKYTIARFDAFIAAKDAIGALWEYDNHDMRYLSFSRVYPK